MRAGRRVPGGLRCAVSRATKTRRPRARPPTRRARRRCSSPESSGTNSISSARSPSSRSRRGWSGSAGSQTSSSSCPNSRPRPSSVELLARDQHHVLAVRAFEVQVVVGLRVGVEVEAAHQPEQPVDAEPVGVQPPPVAEEEVERGEAAPSQTRSTVRRSEPTTSSGSKPVMSRLKNRSESVSPRGRAVGQRRPAATAFRIVPLWQ